MKKTGIRISLVFALVAVLITGLVIPASATPPQRIMVSINSIQSNQINYNFAWDKLGAHSMKLWFTKDGTLFKEFNVSFTKRMPSYEISSSYNDAAITCGHDYAIGIRLFRKNGRQIKGSYAYNSITFFAPLNHSHKLSHFE